MMEFFEVVFDAERYPDRWHLDDPITKNGEVLDANLLPRAGRYTGPKIVSVPVDTRYPGRPMDFSFGYFNFLVVRDWVADLIEAHGGHIQRFPVKMLPNGDTGYEVIFTLDVPKGVIDLSRAEEYEFYTETDSECDLRYGGIPPRQKGMLYKVYPLFLDQERTQGLVFFRPWEQYGSLVVSANLKAALEAKNTTGICFTKVT